MKIRHFKFRKFDGRTTNISVAVVKLEEFDDLSERDVDFSHVTRMPVRFLGYVRWHPKVARIHMVGADGRPFDSEWRHWHGRVAAQGLRACNFTCNGRLDAWPKDELGNKVDAVVLAHDVVAESTIG